MANGQLTQADLVEAEPGLGWPKGWLTARAARAWWAIKAWFQITLGITITFNEGYRPLATQVYFWNLYISGQGNPAAKPGNSKHGTGEAWDLNYPFTSWSTPAQAAWRANEARFGISSAQGVADGEPWHKVNVAETTVAASAVSPIQNGETEMQLIHRPTGGAIQFVDEFGSDNVAVFSSADIANGELVGAMQRVFGWKDATDRDFDIAAAVAQRRWDAKRKQIVAEVVAQLKPLVTAPPAVDVSKLAAALAPLVTQGASADAIAAKVDAILKDDFAAIPKAVNDDTSKRMGA